jgi:transposase
MPWKESRIVDQRLQFLSSYQKEEMSVSDLCREFGVSRQTGYRWINRYKEVGPEGLLNRSSKPNGCSHATTEAIENEIFALRSKHPSWGARKLKARLEMLDPEVNWPAASTFGNILRRAGLTSPKRKKRRTTPYSEPFSEVTAPNQLWCMDFKGYFSTGDGTRCDPFTITDAHSRYLIRCQTVSRMDFDQVRAVSKRPCVSTACHCVSGQITGLRSQELVYWACRSCLLDEAGHRA